MDIRDWYHGLDRLEVKSAIDYNQKLSLMVQSQKYNKTSIKHHSHFLSLTRYRHRICIFIPPETDRQETNKNKQKLNTQKERATVNKPLKH